jgi:O-antigen/teichoic acid export membrane protein
MIIICSVLLWGNITDKPFEISWFVYAQTAAYLITMLITFFAVFVKTEFLKLHFDAKFFIVFLKQSYPFALLILLMSFYNRIDSVMLERLLPDGKEQAGVYAQAFRMLDAATMFAYLFAALLLPMFAKMLKEKQDIAQLTKLSYLLLIVPTIILSLACFSFRHEIMNLMYDAHVEASARIFAVLMLGFISISTTYIFGTLLTSNGNLKYLNIMASFGMVLNIVLNYVLIPKYQAFGSAMASLITQTFTALTQVLIAKNVFKFKIDYDAIIRLSIFVILLIITGLSIPQFFTQWQVSLLIFGIIGIALSFVLKLFNFKELYNILKSKEN